MTVLQRAGAAALAIAAVAVWFLMAPEAVPEAEGHGELLSDVLDSAEANNALADGAPQQEVVNGWAARDLIAVTVRQNDALIEQVHPRDERPAALLVLAVLGIALHALTTPHRNSPAGVTAAADPANRVTPS